MRLIFQSQIRVEVAGQPIHFRARRPPHTIALIPSRSTCWQCIAKEPDGANGFVLCRDPAFRHISYVFGSGFGLHHIITF